METQDVTFDMPEPTRLMLAGDWHGDATWAEIMLDRAKKAGCDAVLQLGDWGYWPRYEEFTRSQTGHCHFTQKMKAYAEKLELPVYWLDGNHENHDALTPGQGNQWLRHLPRGHRWVWWDKTWMSVGGGVSVDKDSRTPGYDWFPGETLSLAEFEYCMRPGDVDIIVAHDCPDLVDIPGVHGQGKTKDPHGWFKPELIAQSEENRALMGLLCDEVAPDVWFHGHYHERYNSARMKDGVNTFIFGLDKNRAKVKELNAIIITKEDIEGVRSQ